MDLLRRRFIETLKLKDDEIIVPEDSQLFVAAGSAFSADRTVCCDGKKFPTIAEFRENLKNLVGAELSEVQRLEPLFNNATELDEFRKRHASEVAARGDLSLTRGPVCLGLGSGSTAAKAGLIDQKQSGKSC